MLAFKIDYLGRVIPKKVPIRFWPTAKYQEVHKRSASLRISRDLSSSKLSVATALEGCTGSGGESIGLDERPYGDRCGSRRDLG